MIPITPILTKEIVETTHPTRTYKINIGAVANPSQGTTDSKSASTLGTCVIGEMILGKTEVIVDSPIQSVTSNRISGYIDDLDAIKQAIYLILNTERYGFLIYPWDYGIELIDLIGQPMPYVLSELPRRVKEALIQDNRISDVVDFEFEKHGKKLHAKFTVITNVGNISTDLEVEV